jgi:hypothetical protein
VGPGRRRRLADLLVAALVVAGTQMVVQTLGAAPAGAAIAANVYTAISESNAEDTKSVVAHCPQGLRVFGGGARLHNDSGRVTVATMIPSHTAAGDRYSVAATERPGVYNEAWSVEAYAVCAGPIPGMEVVMSFTSDEVKKTYARCPANKAVVGSGGAVGATREGAILRRLQPEFRLGAYEVLVEGGRTAGSTAPPDCAVFAFAVCANKPSGYVIREVHESAPGDVTTISSSLTCGGTPVLGTGINLSGAEPGFLTAMYNGVFVGHTRAYRPKRPADEFWGLTTWAICAA